MRYSGPGPPLDPFHDDDRIALEVPTPETLVGIRSSHLGRRYDRVFLPPATHKRSALASDLEVEGECEPPSGHAHSTGHFHNSLDVSIPENFHGCSALKGRV